MKDPKQRDFMILPVDALPDFIVKHLVKTRICLALLVLLLFSTTNVHAQVSDSQVFISSNFKYITKGRVATDAGQSRGVAWGDFDGDGDPDLYVANGSGQWNALYRNDGGTFKKLTDPYHSPYASLVVDGGHSQGVNWVDIDNDNDLDLFVANRGEGASFLYRNDGSEGFTRLREGPLSAPGLSISVACWADYDRDGDLDVFVVGYNTHGNKLFENDGTGAFQERTSLLTAGAGEARACACGDINNDGLAELVVANARKPNMLYINKGNWNFEAVTKGHVVTDVGYSYGVSWADADHDGDLDLFVANFDKQNFLYENKKGRLEPLMNNRLTTETGGASKGHTWGDYDNNGTLDLFVANGTYGPDMRNFLYLNDGKGDFVREEKGLITQHADTSAGTAWADYDRDGDLDLFVANWGGNDQQNRFYENITSGQHWVTLRLEGTTSNRFGIGARATISYTTSSGEQQQTRWMYPLTGFGSQNDYELHFGLSDASRIDLLEITWPDGSTDTHEQLGVNQHFRAIEGGEIHQVR